MIVRIVKMTFRTEEVDAFKFLFESVKEKIRNQKGCHKLQLLQGEEDKRIFFTYSHRDTQEDLDRYRHSELFKETLSKTKAKFDDRPEAWSTQALHSF